MKRLASLTFLLWMGIIIITYYVVQKPDLNALTGLADTLWTLFVAALLLQQRVQALERPMPGNGVRSRFARFLEFRVLDAGVLVLVAVHA